MNEIVDSLERNGLLIWLGRMDAIFVAEQYKKKERSSMANSFKDDGDKGRWKEG